MLHSFGNVYCDINKGNNCVPFEEHVFLLFCILMASISSGHIPLLKIYCFSLRIYNNNGYTVNGQINIRWTEGMSDFSLYVSQTASESKLKVLEKIY